MNGMEQKKKNLKNHYEILFANIDEFLIEKLWPLWGKNKIDRDLLFSIYACVNPTSGSK
jgi:hypothetical protein